MHYEHNSKAIKYSKKLLKQATHIETCQPDEGCIFHLADKWSAETHGMFMESICRPDMGGGLEVYQKPASLETPSHPITGDETDNENETKLVKNKVTINMIALDLMARGYDTQILQIKKHNHILSYLILHFLCVISLSLPFPWHFCIG